MTFAIIILSSILLAMTVIGTGALSGLFSERSGVVNIAIEGFMIVGGLVYVMMSLYLPKDHLTGQVNMWYQIPTMLIAMLVAGIVSLLHAYASITLKANQVISGTAINLLAAGIAVFIVNVVYKGAVSGITNNITNFSPEKSLTQVGYGFSLAFFLTLVLFIMAFIVMNKTRYGLRLRAAGENPHALESQGISVIMTRYQAVVISGMLAGLAGAFFVQWQGAFHGSANGLGYISLAILIFGRWRTEWVFLAALFFSILTGVATATISALDVPAFFSKNQDLMTALPFIISLLALVIFSKRSLAPKANGIAYDRSSR